MIVVCDWLEVAIFAFRHVLFFLFPFFSLSSFPPLLFLVLCVPQFLSPCFSLRPSGNFEYRPIGQRSIIGALMAPIHGRKSSVKYTPGTEVQFECDPHFILIGERKRVCQANGEWTKSGQDKTTESDWFNWVPVYTTRCVGKFDFDPHFNRLLVRLRLGVPMYHNPSVSLLGLKLNI